MTPESPKLEACAECGHAAHAGICLNMASDSGCAHPTRRPAPTASPAPDGVADSGEALLQRLGSLIMDGAFGTESADITAELLRRLSMVQSQSSTMAGLKEALTDAARSLETLSYSSGKKGDGLEDFDQIRSYAFSRATVARAALKPVARGDEA